MRPVVLVAPDSFKGTLTAAEVARALADGIRRGGGEAVELPIGDGGEGTMDALVATLGGELREAPASDPLGRPLTARFALLPDGRAVVETAEASGRSGGLYAYRGAKLVLGAAYVLDTVGFDARMRASRAVVTGEGRLDEQTLAGKAVGEVATRCRQAGVWCHAVVGRNELDDFAIRLLDFASVHEAGTKKELRDVANRLARESGVT